MLPVARILVIDDDLLLQTNLVTWLRTRGYEGVGAVSVAEALRVAAWESFDVAIIDLQLPDGTGIGLLPQLKRLDPRLVCLILTGNASVDNAVAALRHGMAFDFLCKPIIDLTRLQQALDSALAHRRTLIPLPPVGCELPGDLSDREREILDHLASGLANKDIAARTGISEKTVRNHLSAIFRKLGVDNRIQALVLYQQWRMQPDPAC
jgi:DNA-binding NarL/FixJ family response regulator